VFYAELAPGVGAKAELAAGDGFLTPLVYEVYFFAEPAASELRLRIFMADGSVDKRNVYAVRLGAGPTPTVERCQVKERTEVCRELDEQPDLQQFTSDEDDWGEFLRIIVPAQRIDWDSEFLRLTLEEGAYKLQGRLGDNGEDGTKPDADGNPVELDSPALTEALPALNDLERQYLEQRPFFRFAASPFVRDQRTGTGGFDELSASFEGGMYRPSRSGDVLWQLKWSGDVATDAGLSFNRFALEAGGAANLIPRDWLPLTVVAKAESDQGFDAVDLSAEARVAYVLPAVQTIFPRGLRQL
jgi:hypothetical protein